MSTRTRSPIQETAPVATDAPASSGGTDRVLQAASRIEDLVSEEYEAIEALENPTRTLHQRRNSSGQ